MSQVARQPSRSERAKSCARTMSRISSAPPVSVMAPLPAASMAPAVACASVSVAAPKVVPPL